MSGVSVRPLLRGQYHRETRYYAQKWYAQALAMPIDNADDQAAHDDAQKKIKA